MYIYTESPQLLAPHGKATKLLLSCCFTAALLLLYYYFTAVLLLTLNIQSIRSCWRRMAWRRRC
jgi:hypothetical protein